MLNKWLVSALVSMLFASASIFGFLYWDAFYNVRAPQENLAVVLAELQKLDNSRTKEVVKVDRDPLSDFDRLAGYLDESRVLKEQFLASGVTSETSPEYLKNEAFHYLLLLDKKTEQIEHYKSTYAIVRNSKRYLPSARIDLSRVVRESNADPKIKEDVKDGIKVIYDRVVASIETDQENSVMLLGKIDALQLELKNIVGGDLEKNLEFFDHARVLVKHAPIKEEIITELLTGDLQNALASLTFAYDRFVDTKLSIRNQRLLISFIAFLSLSFIVIGVTLFSRRIKQVSLPDAVINEVKDSESVDYSAMKTIEKAILLSRRYEPGGGDIDELLHEVNDALRYLKTNTDNLSQLVREHDPTSASEDIPGVIQTVNNSIHHIETVVNQLHVPVGVTHILEAWFDLNDCVKSVIQQCQSKMGPRIHLRQKLCSEAKMYGVQSEVEQVLFNLLSNSVHAIEQSDKVRACIEITTLFSAGKVSFIIKDSGQGMSEEVQSHIFEPSYTTQTSSMGAGLGLYIVKEHVAKHRGKIKVVSQEGKGTAICIVFAETKENGLDMSGVKSA